MLIGRETERRQLKELYESSANSLTVLYGRKGMGKTALAKEFIEEKPAAYYAARECTDREQQLLLSREWGFGREESPSVYKYRELIENMIDKLSTDSAKVVILIDEFQLLLKENEDFTKIIHNLLQTERKVMFLLMSSSINWVENNMVNDFKVAAKYMTSIIKLKEISFADMVKYYKKLSVEQCIYINAILGGVPGYMRLWHEGKSLKENLNRLFFSSEGELFNEAENFLKSELRELSAYNTILAALASGKHKLNDIHSWTGFSRAKISVYIKNLMQLDVVEKVFSFETADRENIQKGLYRIRDNFVNFWYRYVYPNKSAIKSGNGKKIYNLHFLPETSEYMRYYFAQVCEEFLRLLSTYKRLAYVYKRWGSWHGKNAMIDVLGEDGSGHYIAALCSFKAKASGAGILDECNTALSFAGISASEIYLFSKSGFTNEFKEKVKDNKSIVLIDMKDL